MSLLARRLLVVLGFLILVGGALASQFLAGQKKEPPRKAEQAAIKSVETFNVTNQSIPTTLEVQGQLVAFDKIDIFSEVSGTLVSSAKPFKEGTYFPKGATLIKVDEMEAKLALQSQKSTLMNTITQMMPDLKIDYKQGFDHWNNYLEGFDPDHPIQPIPEATTKQEKFFIASRNIYSQYYNIKSAEERLGKYVIKAPFSGVITEAMINPGTLVRNGQKLGVLMNTNNYELEATVALRDLKYLQVGNQVQLYSDDIEGKWTGRIKRINNMLDAGTQTVKLFISVNGKNLREGMYLRGDVAASKIENAVRLPKGLLVNQKAVFAVRDTLLSLLPVEVVKTTRDHAIVRGIGDETQLLKNKIPGSFDGMRVNISSKPTS